MKQKKLPAINWEHLSESFVIPFIDCLIDFGDHVFLTNLTFYLGSRGLGKRLTLITGVVATSFILISFTSNSWLQRFQILFRLLFREKHQSSTVSMHCLRLSVIGGNLAAKDYSGTI